MSLLALSSVVIADNGGYLSAALLAIISALVGKTSAETTATGRRSPRWVAVARVCHTKITGILQLMTIRPSALWERGIYSGSEARERSDESGMPTDRSRRTGSILMTTETSTLYAAIIAAIGAIGAAVAPALTKRWQDNRRSKAFDEGIDRAINMGQRLSDFEEHGGDRVLYFKTDSEPTPGSLFTVTCTDFFVSDTLTASVIESYRHLSIDTEYRKMLRNGKKRMGKVVRLRVGEMPACDLKRYYEAEGISESLLIVFGMFQGSLRYMTVARHSGVFTGIEATKIELLAHDLWNDLTGESAS